MNGPDRGMCVEIVDGEGDWASPVFADPAISHVRMVSAAPISDVSLGDLLRRVAREHPDAIALAEPRSQFGEAARQWTYRQLLAEAERAARALLARFRPGEHVAIWSGNSPEWIILQYACALADIVLVTANPANREREMRYILDQSRSVGIFLTRAFRDIDADAIITCIAPDLPGLRDVVYLDRWTDFLASAPDGIALPVVDCDRPAMIQYTSGTTGQPKGAMLPHRALVNCGQFVADALALGRGAAWYVSVPLFHTSGCVYGVIATLWNVGRVLVTPGFDPRATIAAIEEDGANGMALVPTMLLRMLQEVEGRDADLSALRVIVTGGTTVPGDLVVRVEQTLGCDVVMTFGQTETGCTVAQSARRDTLENRTATVGRLFPHIEARITDPRTGEIVPLGEVGEIELRGYMAFCGYYDMPDATAATLTGEGWLHTGDLGTMRGDGYLTISGRLKDVVNRGGEKIFPREIEDLLGTHPDVADCAMFAVPDPEWGEVGVIAVKPVAGAAQDDAALLAWLGARLARYKVPRTAVFVSDLPVTQSGKIQKFALRERYLKGDLPGGEGAAP